MWRDLNKKRQDGLEVQAALDSQSKEVGDFKDPLNFKVESERLERDLSKPKEGVAVSSF